MAIRPLVPELQVSDLAVSLEFYTRVLGFSVAWRRPEELFAFIEREEAASCSSKPRDLAGASPRDR